jgi:bilirubin oxidase
MLTKFTLRTLAGLLFLLVITNAAKAQFVNPIPIPPLIRGDTFHLEVRRAMHNFNPAQVNDSLYGRIGTECYNMKGDTSMSYLGPTMVWTQGQQIQIDVHNTLNERTTSHWHGLNLPGQWDGGPQEPIDTNEIWKPQFKIIDPIQTVWYHSHLMDTTTLQVTMGLAGMIIIEDTIADTLRKHLPHDYGFNDFPVIIQEKAFIFDTTFTGNDTTYQVAAIDTAGGGTIHTPGNGPYTLINGVVHGTLNVPNQMVRIRMLNGSPRKSFQVGLNNSLTSPGSASFNTYWLIATDGGYTSQPFPIDSNLISPGERMEFLMDFTGMGHGDTVYLRNLTRSMPNDVVKGGGAPPAANSVTPTSGNAFLAFVVDTTIQPTNPITTLPDSLLRYTVDTSNIFKRRFKALKNAGGGGGSGGQWTIDGKPFNMDSLNDVVLVNTKETWTIHNTTNIAHPFHIHKVQFQVISYTGLLGTDADSTTKWVTNLTPWDAAFPAYMRGYKDDVLVRAGATLTFMASFDSFPETTLDVMGAFMYHCHILTHEDNDMMHQFAVVDAPTYGQFIKSGVNVPAEKMGDFMLYPNPAGSTINLQGHAEKAGKVRIIDMLGRVLREESILAFDGSTAINVEALPRGMVIIEWTSGKDHYTQKVLLK